MNKNDIIKTESGIFRILSIEKENVLAILFDIITENREIYKQVFASL